MSAARSSGDRERERPGNLLRRLAISGAVVASLAALLAVGLGHRSPLPRATGPAAAAEAGGVELSAGRALERTLRPSDSHAYRLDLAAGDFVDLVVDQGGVDVVATLLDPSGAPLLEADAPIGRLGPEPLRIVAGSAGTHRLVVRAWEGEEGPGRYRLTVHALRPATDRDRRRAEGARVFAAAEALGWQGRHRESIAVYRKAGAIGRDVADLALRAESADRVCAALWALRALREAVPVCRSSVALFRRAGDRRREAMALANEGVVRFSLGETATALRLYDRAHRLAEEAGDRSTAARVLAFRGQAHQVRDETRSALNAYTRSLPGLKGPHHAADRALVLQNLGVLYRLLGRPALARDRLEAAEAAWTEAGDRRRLAATVNQLGELARADGRDGEAGRLFERALGLRRALEDRRGEAKTLEKLALLRLEEGDPASARKLLEAAFDRLEEVDDRRAHASARLVLGWIEAREGRPERALVSLGAALELYRGVGDRSEEAECLHGIARAERASGRLERALAAAEEGLDRLEAVRSSTLRRDLRTSFFATVDDHFDLAIDVAMELARTGPDAAYAARGLALAERARARTLLDGLLEAGVGARPPEGARSLDRLREIGASLEAAERRRAALVAVATGGDLAPARAATERRVRELAAALEETRARLRSGSARVAALDTPRAQRPLGSAADPRAALDLGTRLLEYRLGRDRGHLWTLSDAGLVAVELPARAAIEPIARRAHELLRESHRRETRAALERTLCRLAETVIGPIVDRLTEERLVVVPDGALAYVPFAALPRPRGPEGAGCHDRPLLVDHEVVYLPSVAALAAVRDRAAGRARPARLLAVVADPAGAGLPHARREGEAILRMAPIGSRLGAFGEDADLRLVRSGVLGGYRIVHFATHGVLDSERPELSGLRLARDGSGGTEAGAFLRAHELYDLELPAELVVLSACETALGAEVRGEGLIGLGHAFLQAGAERVVVSLWRVGDRSTALLMERFYHEVLRSGRPPGAALREAQLALYREPRHAPPYRWAGFVLQGEWR